MPEVLARAEVLGVPTPLMSTSFYLGHEHLVLRGTTPMPRWRKKLFVAIARNAAGPAAYFGLPDERTITIGSRIPL